MFNKIIIGLGNPGKRYQNTRHNLGWFVLDKFVEQNHIDCTWKEEKKHKAEVADIRFEDQRILLVKPSTFMNDSGITVRSITDYYDIDIDSLLIIHDDLDIDLGKIKISKTGSSGGHNGIKSIINHMSSKEFLRIKIGINSSKRGRIPTEKFVLQPFGFWEKRKAKDVIEQSADAVNCIISKDLSACMNRFN